MDKIILLIVFFSMLLSINILCVKKASSISGAPKYAIILLITVGSLGFLGGITLPYFDDVVSSHMQLPLINANGLVVKDNKIYIGLQTYGRIHVYNINGNFVKNIRINTNGGIFKMLIGYNDTLNIYTSRSGRHIIIDKNDNIISDNIYFNDIDDIRIENETFYENSNYQLINRFLYPIVESDSTVIVRPLVYIWFLGAPLPSFFFLMFGLFLLFKYNKVFHKR